MAEAFERAAVRTARSWGAWVRRRIHTTADELVDESQPSTIPPGARRGRSGHAHPSSTFRIVGRVSRPTARGRVAFASLSAGMSPTENPTEDADVDGDSERLETGAEEQAAQEKEALEPAPEAAEQGLIGETVVYVEDDADTGLTKVTLITVDRTNLMADIGSAFGSMGMNIRTAEISTGEDNFVQNTFVVAGPDLGPVKWEEWDKLKSRLKASCSKRGRSKPWQERESRLRELFSRIDSMGTGYIAQEDLDIFAQSLRMPRAFVHDFVDEGDQSGEGKMSFEEFAAFVRSKEISLQASFDSLQPDSKGRIKGARLKKNLKNLEIRAGRYNSRKKIRAKGVERMLKYVDDDATLTAADFRDMMILIPNGQLQTVSPYYMKVGLDIGPRRLPIPDRRKDGSPWGHLFAGGLAGIASKTVSSPLNVVAVRSIASSDGTGAAANSAREIFKRMKHISRTEGIRGLFKGNTANSVSSAPGKAIDFFAYAAYKKLLTGNSDREPTNLERLLAGSLAGMTSDTLLYPLEVVSTRVTMDSGKYGSLAAAFAKIAKKEGLRGLYAGWGSAMVGVVPYAGFSFGCYDILSAQYRRAAKVDSAGPLPTLCIGFISGFLASTVSFPLYSATVKLQSGAPIPGLIGPKTMSNVIRATIKQGGGGFKALFVGWFPSAMKIVPQAGTSFVVYEMVKRRLDSANYEVEEDDE